jgi:D-alanine-D-alanine ligase
MKSGKVVIDFLDHSLYQCYCVIIDLEGWRLVHQSVEYPIDKSDFSVTMGTTKMYFDGVFMAIHGAPGENGVLQNYFDQLNIPYTTSGEEASKMCFDKGRCNNFLKTHGISCAKSVQVHKGQEINLDLIIEKLALPCFVKPNSNGSSFGVSKVNSKDQLPKAIEKAFEHDDCVLMESFISGTEVSCGVHNLNGTIETFPITEIVSENDFFDFEAKYQGKSKEITPARISSDVANEIAAITQRVYHLLNLNGLARIDFIIMNQKPYLIEANTVPGLSKESIIPQQAKVSGMSLSDLFNKSVEHMFNSNQ